MIDIKPIEALLNANCIECQADTEKSIDTYITQMEKLQDEIDELKASNEKWMLATPVHLEVKHGEAINTLLDLLEKDITDKEQLILPDESNILKIIAAYRAIRPK